MKKYLPFLTSILLSLGILFTLNHYLVPISYFSPVLFAKVKPYLLPVGYYNQRACSDLKRYLKGKRVAIVGPAGSFQGSQYGAGIDSHDIVVRVNSAVWDDWEFRRDFGSRTDILFGNFNNMNLSSFKENLKNWSDAHFLVAMDHLSGDLFENVVANNPILQIILRQTIDNRMTFCNLADDFFRDFKAHYIFYANTGIATLAFLLTTKLESLDIYGFDFYGSGYHKWMEKESMRLHQKDTVESMRKVITDSSKVHNQEKQFAYFEKYIISDKRVTFLRPISAEKILSPADQNKTQHKQKGK